MNADGRAFQVRLKPSIFDVVMALKVNASDLLVCFHVFLDISVSGMYSLYREPDFSALSPTGQISMEIE